MNLTKLTTRLVSLGAQALRESSRSPSPAYRRSRPGDGAAAPLPAPVAGAAEVAEALRWSEQRIDTEGVPFGLWTWFLRAPGPAVPLVAARAEALAGGGVRITARAAREDSNHLVFELPLRPGERIVGLGERFNAVDQRGWRLENWTEEGGVGLGETLSPLLTRLGVPWNPFPKGPAFSYKPVPWLLSSRGYGLFVSGTAPMFFDVGAAHPNVLRGEVMAREVELTILFGPEPAALVQQLVDLTDGRPRGLPDWALAPWLDAFGGEARVRQVAATLRREGIPCAAIWAEDWQGGRQRPFGDSKWSYDAIFPVRRRPCPERYPRLGELLGDLHADGFKFLAYYYPYVDPDDEDYATADAQGWFLRDARGRTRRLRMFLDQCAQVDLTHAEGRRWYKEELRRGLRLGFDGWMADFGEYTPLDVVAADGEPGLVHHNRYPRLWARLNREVMEEERPDGDFVFFSRSGGPGQQRDTPIFWTGDSNTDFERWDGLPSNLRGLLSAGLSGFSVWTVDVGGYMCIATRGRDAETLARWTELAAFLVVMRTHHGTHLRRCIQFDHDADTLGHFATYARFHAALFPLRKALLQEATRTGLPVARPLLLEHPGDPEAWAVEDQFLLGPDLLVAPIVERGARTRRVYLLAGRDWIDLWTGARHTGGAWISAAAPLGRIPLYLASDGLLPTFDRPVDTFVRRAAVENPALRTLEDAEASLALLVGPDFRGPIELYDGTRIERVEAATSPAPAAAADHPHHLLPAELTRAWPARIAGHGTELLLPLPDRWLRVRSPRPRRLVLRTPGP